MQAYKNALEFLQSHRLASFVTIAAEEPAPHIALVYYLNSDSYHIYIATVKNSRKIRDIKANPRVALVIAQEVEPKTLQLEGTASLVSDIKKQQELIAQYAEVANTNSSQVLPPLYHLSQDSEMVFIEITITAFKYSDFSEVTKQITEGTPADWKN